MIATVMKPTSVSNNKPVPIPQNSRRSRGESFGSLPSASSPLTTGSSLDRVSASSPSRRLTEPSQSKLSVDSRKSGKGLTESCTPASSVRHGFDPKIAPVSVVPISSKSGGPQSKGLLSSSLAGTRQPSPEAVLQVCINQLSERCKFCDLWLFQCSRSCLVLVTAFARLSLPGQTELSCSPAEGPCCAVY